MIDNDSELVLFVRNIECKIDKRRLDSSKGIMTIEKLSPLHYKKSESVTLTSLS
jgi:hypothetical protein